MEPSRDEVGCQLERLLTSESFANAERARRFLRYVVERTLAGEGDRLKEFVIGVDVFDRDDQYDPRIDSIVRVEAGRIRSKLDQYYSRASEDDRVIIRIPRGSYLAEFERREPDLKGPAYVPALEPDLRGPAYVRPPGVRPAALGGIAALVVAGALVWDSRSGPESPVPAFVPQAVSPELRTPSPEPSAPIPEPPNPKSEPSAPHSPSPARGPESRATSGDGGRRGQSGPVVSVIVLPFEHFSTDREVQLLAARFTDGVTSELARIKHVSVVSRTSAVQMTAEGKTLRDIARAVDAQVVVEGSLLVEGTRVHADVRLVDTVVDRKSWSRQFAADVSDMRSLQRQVAVDLAAFVRPRPQP